MENHELNDIALISSDGCKFTISRELAERIGTIGELLKISHGPINLTVPDCEGYLLEIIIKYCLYHIEDDYTLSKIYDPDITKYDRELIKNLGYIQLMKLTNAAIYLNIMHFYDKLIDKIASDLKGKTVEQVRIYMGIDNYLDEES